MMQSPIQRMQREFGHYDRLSSFGRFGAGLAIAGFGNTLTQSAVTGVKSGVSAAGITTTIGSGVASAISAGAAAGSFIPIIGTAIGIIVALVASGVFNHRTDPEVGNFNNAVNLFKNNPDGIYNIADKYLVLAGLFDLEPGQIKGNIPIVKKYGRLGEEHFTQDMANRIYTAAQTGVIGPSDTPQTVMAKVVQPWIDGFGYGPMQDSNAEMINDILVGMIAEYVTGLWKTRWYARSGDMPNWQIPVFSLPSGAGVTPSTAGTPTQASAPLPPVATPIFTQPVISAPLITAPAQPVQSAVAVPAGFSVIGSDAITGLPLYVGPDGRYYGWNGVTMTPFTGNAVSGGQMLSVQGGVPSTSSTVNPALLGNPDTSLPPIPLATPQDFSSVPAPAPSIAPTAAGVSTSGLPSWFSLAAIGGVVFMLMMTGRPVGGSTRKSAYKRARR